MKSLLLLLFIGTRHSMPGPYYPEKVLKCFENINSPWLLASEGESFKQDAIPTQNQITSSGKKNTAAGANGKNGATTDNCNLAYWERECASLPRQVKLLNGQLYLQKTSIESKDEMLDLRKGRLYPAESIARQPGAANSKACAFA